LLPSFTLYVEWLCRAQAECKWPLPYEFKSFGFLQSFTVRDKNNFDFHANYMHFVKFVQEEGNIIDLLETLPFATLAAKSTHLAATFSAFVQDHRSVMQAADKARSTATLSLRQIATKKLENMRIASRDSYALLVKAYIESLDESSRRMILDVQKHMQPELFDEHLNHRMLHFMVENPTLWQNSEHALH
jgi:hypothetical protein